MKTIIQSLCMLVLAGTASASLAVTEYVTDRIEIGVHQQPDVNSPIITRLSTGESVEVLQQHNNFKRVQLENGTQGWIRSAFLSADQPSTVEYDQLLAKNKELAGSLEQKNEQLKKLQRDLQVRQDQLSNARSTIKELKASAEAGSQGDTPDQALTQQLAEKEQQVAALQEELATLKEQAEQSPTAPSDTPGIEQYQAQLEQQKQLNRELQTRIDLANNLLTRDQLPSAEEIATMQNSLPGWYWGTMLTVLIIGIVGGIAWMDYRLRRRHGGFRI